MTATATPPPTTARGDEPLLSVRDLRVTFQRQGERPFTAVDGVSFDVRPGQTVGLVGESGCGTSVTSLAIMTRCRIPPDIWCGYSPSRRPGSAMPTSRSACSAISSACRGLTFW